MTNYAKTEKKSVWIKYDFGNKLARKWFGDKAIDALPKITRGKNTGKPKGVLVWTKCTHGGWVTTGAYNWDTAQATGYVMPKGCHFHEIREYGYSDSVWLRTDDLLKNHVKRDKADNKKRAEIQADIEREKRAIACYQEIKDDSTIKISDNLKDQLAKDAERAEIRIKCHIEYLEYLETGYFKKSL